MSWSRCRGKNFIKKGPRSLSLVPSAVEDFVTTPCSLVQSAEKAKPTKQQLSRSWEVQPDREARCCHCSSAISWLKERGSKWIPSSVPANCACAVLGSPHSKWEMASRMFLCQDPLQRRDVEQAKLGTAFLTVSHALLLLSLCRSECDLCPLLSQAQTTDMESSLANLNFQCTLKVVLCPNSAEDRSRKCQVLPLSFQSGERK